MATSGEFDNDWVEEMFTQLETVVFHRMLYINENMKCIVELKSKVRILEEQENKLQVYVKMLNVMIHKSRNNEKIETWISNFNNAINELEMSVLNIQKEIAVLKSEKKVEIKPIENNKELVLSTGKVFPAFHKKCIDLVLESENKLFKLKNQKLEFYVTQNLSKEKQELDGYIKQYDLLKAKNLHLKELMHFSIKQNI